MRAGVDELELKAQILGPIELHALSVHDIPFSMPNDLERLVTTNIADDSDIPFSFPFSSS